MIRIALVIALFFLAFPAAAKPVVADMSLHQIRIDSSFTGTELLMFGARNQPGDVIVVIRGPQRSVIVRKKERVMGIWANRKQAVLENMPGYYSIASTKKLEDLQNVYLFPTLNIGLTPAALSFAHDKEDLPYLEAVIRQQKYRGLFVDQVPPVTFMEDTLFKTAIPFPDSIPRGQYTAEVYLFRDGELMGMQSTPIEVVKTGFEAWVYDLAHGYPALYGILAVLMALSIGWAASRAFARM